ncbi:MAG: hypothetical protein AMS26_01695 [Bacteroides sp. SM23_62]|nr:MAG: hypothetical protein AMS26_01695 [Bacteroides sp. SM23_62]
MKKLAIPVLFLFCFSSSVYTLDDVTYPRKPISKSGFLNYHVPSEYPTIQSAVDAAFTSGLNNITIIVEEGEYRETVIATGLKNLKLIGRNARILPPSDYEFIDPPEGDSFPASSFKLINCENFRVEGFTFIGDNFADITRQSYPMGNSIHSYNSSGTISNNIIFNYFDGICFQVDNLRWMKGVISDNYIHNCIWSGIFAIGSHNLLIQNNKIAFTIPKVLSISVGIWTDGGIGLISENHIINYWAVDYYPQQKKLSSSDLWPINHQFTPRENYQVTGNTFEQSAAVTQISNLQMAADRPYRFLRKTHKVYNHFINVSQGNNNKDQPDIVMLRPE